VPSQSFPCGLHFRVDIVDANRRPGKRPAAAGRWTAAQIFPTNPPQIALRVRAKITRRGGLRATAFHGPARPSGKAVRQDDFWGPVLAERRIGFSLIRRHQNRDGTMDATSAIALLIMCLRLAGTGP